MKTSEMKLPKGISYRKSDGRYMGRFTYHNESHTVYGKTVKEAVKNLETARYQIMNGVYFKDDSITFDSWFEVWINDYKKPNSKTGTINTYTQNYRAYIHDTLGKRQMRDIRTDQIQRFYNILSDKVSHNTLEVCRAILNGMYTQAIRNELLQKNPVANAVLPKDNKKHTAKVLSESEQRTFLKYAKSSRFYPIYELALSTGMRSGELRGLQWSDIDFENRVIHVTHTLVYYDGTTFLDSPKTQSSERDIPMLNNVEILLKQQRRFRFEYRAKMGELWNPVKEFEDLVFTNYYGNPIDRDCFKRDLDKVIKQMVDDGIPFPRITPHTFRHTFATRSIEHGISYKVLQTIMGHSDLSTTMDTYAHVLPNTKASEMEKLENMFKIV